MDDIARAADAGQHRPGLRAAEVVEAGLGQQGLQRFPIAGLQALPDGGGADGPGAACRRGDRDQAVILAITKLPKLKVV